MAATPRTPSPQLRSSHDRVPDAPLHGARYDESPRRSRRTTRNPYSTSRTSPDTSGKGKEQQKCRVSAHATPPLSPSSPGRTIGSPRGKSAYDNAPVASSKFSGRKSIDRRSMLLTPAKTPRMATPPSTATSNRLLFAPADPNDVMPTPRKLKKLGRNSALASLSRDTAEDQVEVYSDWNARLPTRDESEDNPFIGQRKSRARAQNRSINATPQPLSRDMSEKEMKKRVDNHEGLIYSFRGKKIFRPFEDTLTNLEEAEALGYEPIRRSRGQPRRLTFGIEEVDEEALTEIEEDGPAISSQGQEERARARSGRDMFSTWPRSKASAGESRKRDAADHDGSASKRAKNSP